MTDLNEPADGGVAVVELDDPDGGKAVFRRRDDIAERDRLGDARWFCETDSSVPALTWFGVTILGRVVSGDQVVDRSEVKA